MSEQARCPLPSGDRKLAPKLVIGLIHGELARGLEAKFKQAGWRVCSADSGDEVREIALLKHAAAVVLPVAADGESGFLTCAKLTADLPAARVVLVGPATEENERFALFAGAAGYVADTATAAELAQAITGTLVRRM